MQNNLNSPEKETPAEKAKRLGVEFIPPLPKDFEKKLPEKDPTLAVCGECGMELKSPSFFSCRNERCPVMANFK